MNSQLSLKIGVLKREKYNVAMLLYEHSPDSKLTDMALEASKSSTGLIEEKREIETVDEKGPRWPLQIQLPSSETILCTSDEFILTNHLTKRKNRLVLFDQHRNQIPLRSPIKGPILEVIWVEKISSFLLLTEKMIWALDVVKKQVQLVEEIKPKANKTFKTFTLINLSILIVGYDEWQTSLIDRWELIETSKKWTKIDPMVIQLNEEEFIGHLSTDVKDGQDLHVIVPIYNDTFKEWRIQFIEVEQYRSVKQITSTHLQVDNDLKLLAVYNEESNVDYLIYLPGTNTILVVDKNSHIMRLQNKFPIQELGIFKKNYFLMRTTKNLDVHFII